MFYVEYLQRVKWRPALNVKHMQVHWERDVQGWMKIQKEKNSGLVTPPQRTTDSWPRWS